MRSEMIGAKDTAEVSDAAGISTSFAIPKSNQDPAQNQDSYQSQQSRGGAPATTSIKTTMASFLPQPIGPPNTSTTSQSVPTAAPLSSNATGLSFSSQPAATSSAPSSPVFRVIIQPYTEKAAHVLQDTIATAVKDFKNKEILMQGASKESAIPITVLSFGSFESASSAEHALTNLCREDKFWGIELVDHDGLRRSISDCSYKAPLNVTLSSSLSSTRESVRTVPAFMPYDAGVTEPPVTYYGNGYASSGSSTVSNGNGNRNKSASLESASNLINSEPIDTSASVRPYLAHSPIGNHLGDRTRLSGKDLIRNESRYEDESFGFLPTAQYANTGTMTSNISRNNAGFTQAPPYKEQASDSQPRRTTELFDGLSEAFDNLAVTGHEMLALGEPHITVNAPTNAHMAHLTRSIPSGPPSLGPTPANLLANLVGPYTSMHGHPSQGFDPRYLDPRYQDLRLPPANPSDQNPPCNTLYVGNLPLNTTEDELKSLFSRQRGFKRMCFRAKNNGPMCFVEFDSITAATKTLLDLYGRPLIHSSKGGIRLSFSKNPLGVRSQNNPNNAANYRPTPSHMVTAGTFAPPPGLFAPPGLGNIGSVHNGNGLPPQQYPPAQYFGQLPAQTSMPPMSVVPSMTHLSQLYSSAPASRDYPYQSLWPQPAPSQNFSFK